MVDKVTTDIDFGANAILRETKLINGSFIKVGLQGEKGQHPAGDGKFNDVTVVDVGITNEFGDHSRHIPERSFLRSTFDNKNRQWSFLTKVLLGKILLRSTNTRKALGILGLKLQSDIKRKIRSNVPPPNAESTIERKLGRSQRGVFGPVRAPKTLIDTGRMLNSIIFVRTMKGLNK